MKLKNVEIKQTYPHGYGRGAKPGFGCTVTLQYGEMNYETFDVTLSAEATREVMALAATRAMEQSAIDLDAIDVGGAPGEPELEPLEAPPPPYVADRAPTQATEEVVTF